MLTKGHYSLRLCVIHKYLAPQPATSEESQTLDVLELHFKITPSDGIRCDMMAGTNPRLDPRLRLRMRGVLVLVRLGLLPHSQESLRRQARGTAIGLIKKLTPLTDRNLTFDPPPWYQISFPTMQCATLHDTLHSTVKTWSFYCSRTRNWQQLTNCLNCFFIPTISQLIHFLWWKLQRLK